MFVGSMALMEGCVDWPLRNMGAMVPSCCVAAPRGEASPASSVLSLRRFLELILLMARSWDCEVSMSCTLMLLWTEGGFSAVDPTDDCLSPGPCSCRFSR